MVSIEKLVEISYQIIYNSIMIPAKAEKNIQAIDQTLDTEKITPKLVQYIALLWGRRFPVDLVVRKEKEIERNFRAKNPFYIHHIFKDGKVVYEKEK